MRGQPGHNTAPLALLPPSLQCMDDLTTERSFGSQATWLTDVLGLFFNILYVGVFYNQALADVRSTDAGIKCLYCSSSI